MCRKEFKKFLESRVLSEAKYIINNCSTIRDTAKQFGISKSTVHLDLTKKLKEINMTLYKDVMFIIECNKEERHLRGGAATKVKYKRAA